MYFNLYNILFSLVTIFISVIIAYTFFYYFHLKNFNKRKSEVSTIIIASILLVIISIAFFYYFLKIEFEVSENEMGNHGSTLGLYGDFFGGFLGTLITGFLGYYAYKTYRDQKYELKRQEIENRFYFMLNIHRDNKNNVKFTYDKTTKEGVDAFRDAIDNFKIYYSLFERLINDSKHQRECIEYTWVFLFLGFNQFLSYLKINDVNKGVKDFFLIIGDSRNPKYIEFYNNYNKYYGNNIEIRYIQRIVGYQVAFDNYFRHLFQTVNYINNQSNDILSYEMKYEYIKTLRAQLSNAEQTIIFINSLSYLGKKWEPHKIEITEIEKVKLTEINKSLITKYNFIKNIPLNSITVQDHTIDFTQYYPLIKYEHQEDKSEDRLKLEGYYR